MSGVHDPFGLVSPVVVEVIFLVQEPWRKDFDWDVILLETQTKVFREMFGEGQQERLASRRQYVQMKGRDTINLHVLADASEKAALWRVMVRQN